MKKSRLEEEENNRELEVWMIRCWWPLGSEGLAMVMLGGEEQSGGVGCDLGNHLFLFSLRRAAPIATWAAHHNVHPSKPQESAQ